jgi:hypothetical protein
MQQHVAPLPLVAGIIGGKTYAFGLQVGKIFSTDADRLVETGRLSPAGASRQRKTI